jgi:hypothetical protein
LLFEVNKKTPGEYGIKHNKQQLKSTDGGKYYVRNLLNKVAVMKEIFAIAELLQRRRHQQ